MAAGAGRVRIAIATAAIRACFTSQRPPVRDDEWDEADYRLQRERAYREALAAIGVEFGADSPAAAGQAFARCPATGDAVFLDPRQEGGYALQAQLRRALARVFTDASAWRRSLLPAYYARHRAWRERVGGPIQH